MYSGTQPTNYGVLSEKIYLGDIFEHVIQAATIKFAFQKDFLDDLGLYCWQ